MMCKNKTLVGARLTILLLATGITAFTAAFAERNLRNRQEEFLSWKFGMFIHFNMATFVPGEWATGREDPLLFNPTGLDVGQWAAAATAAHMQYAVLTVKHTGGWCLWDSAHTDHDVRRFKNYRNGQGDLVREFCDAFRKQNIKVGFYYCFPLGGKQWANYGTLPVAGYETGKTDSLTFVKNQFTELLTRYGKIDLVWIDQYSSKNGSLKPGDWRKVKAHIHSLQPDCIVIANNSHDFKTTDIHSYEYPYSLDLPPVNNTSPAEVCDKLQAGWFNNPRGSSRPLRDVNYLVHRMLLPLMARHSNYLLNCAPDERGLLPDSVVDLLRQVGKSWNSKAPLVLDLDRSGIIQSAVRRAPNDNNLVALIFDTTSNPADLETPAAFLSRHGVNATFFFTAAAFESAPEKIRALVAQGHEIGNGSKRGQDLSPLKTGLALRDEVEALQKRAWALLKSRPLVFRAPVDIYAEPLWGVLNYFDLIPVAPAVVMTASTKGEGLASQIKNGSIIALGNDVSEEQLSALLAVLKQKNLSPVPLRQLMEQARLVRLRNLARTGKKDVVAGTE